MRYLLFICTDGIDASDPEEELIEGAVQRFITEMRDHEVAGHPLLGPESATSVRVRNGQTLLSDGPFAETKEHIGGFILIECAGREEAIQIAASHPLAWFHQIEVRPCDPADNDWTDAVLARLRSDPPPERGGT